MIRMVASRSALGKTGCDGGEWQLHAKTMNGKTITIYTSCRDNFLELKDR